MPIISDEGGGGSAGLASSTGRYVHAFESIAAGAAHELTWQFVDGAALLDLAAPTLPLVTADGVYALSAQVNFDTPTTPGRSAVVQVICDFADTGLSTTASGPLTLTQTLRLAQAITVPLLAGMGLLVDVTHDDSAALLCQLVAQLTRLS